MWRHLLSSAHTHIDSVKDYSLAGTLITAPAWMPPISDVNEWVPLASFAVGTIVGVHRMWVDHKRSKKKD